MLDPDGSRGSSYRKKPMTPSRDLNGPPDEESGPVAGNGLSSDDVTVVEPRALRRTVAAAAIGKAVEWFDYGVYASLGVGASAASYRASRRAASTAGP